MPRPYSQDLRDRVVASVASGRSRRTTAKIFSVSVATVVRWSQRFTATGSAAALTMGGRRPHRLAGRRDWLLARIADKPDLTLRALLAELAADGVKVSHGALWAFFAREGITFKKTRLAKSAGIVAVQGWPGRHPGRDGTECAGFARAVAAQDGGADPSMPRGWPIPARARRSGAAASR
jgi:transposase